MNPIRVLTKILGGLFDDDNRITIPGFYDGVKDTPPEILEQWKKLGFTPETFLEPVGLSIPAGEKGRLLVEQASTRPTCDVNGIWGGYIGEGSKTVIPSQASAKVSFRLVQGQDPLKIRKAFRDYVTARFPADCKVEFGDHSAAPAVALDWNMQAARRRQEGADRGMGQGDAADRLRRLDPDRRRLQAHAWARLAARRFRARRRQHPLAEREVRLAQLPERHPLLGAHPRGAGGGEVGREDFILVLASAAKQSRIPSRKKPGLRKSSSQ